MGKLNVGALFLLLAVTLVLCHEYKTEFSQKFEEDLNTYTMEYFVQTCKRNGEFIENLLNEVKPDSKHIPKIREYINAFATLKGKLEGEKVSTEVLVQDILDIRKYMDLDELVDSLDGEDVSKSSKLLEDDTNEEIKVEMSDKVKELWSELYKNIPAEELTKYKEYNSINDIFKLMSDPKNHKFSVLDTALEEIVEFFEYTTWKKLF